MNCVLMTFWGPSQTVVTLGYRSLVRVTKPGLVMDRVMGTYHLGRVEHPGVVRTQGLSRLFE